MELSAKILAGINALEKRLFSIYLHESDECALCGYGKHDNPNARLRYTNLSLQGLSRQLVIKIVVCQRCA